MLIRFTYFIYGFHGKEVFLFTGILLSVNRTRNLLFIENCLFKSMLYHNDNDVIKSTIR